MHSNIGEFYGAFSTAIHNRRNILAGAGAWAALGGAAYAGGQLYNNRTNHNREWLGNSMSYAGAAVGGIMAGKSLGLGNLMTSGGLQRLGGKLQGVKFSEGLLGNSVHKAGEGVSWMAAKQEAGINYAHTQQRAFLDSAYGQSKAGEVPLARANSSRARMSNGYI